MHEIINFLISTLPECLLNILAVLIFLGSNEKKLWFRLMLFGLGDAVIGSVILHFTSSFALATLINIPLSIIFLYWLLRDKWWLTIKLFLLYYVFLLFSYTIAILYSAYVIKTSTIPIIAGFTMDTWVWFCSYLISVLVALPSRRLRPAFLDFMAKLEENQHIAGFKALWMVLLLQVLLLLAFFGDIAFRHNFAHGPWRGMFVLITFFLLLGSTIFILTRALYIAEARASAETQQAVTENVKNLITSVRSQRHDFVNHIQVIRSLMQMNKNEELSQYISQLSNEITLLNDMLNLDNPFLGALLNTKIAAAEMQGIRMEVCIEAWSPPASIDSRNLDLVRIMGNLIDNSMEAVQHSEMSQKWIKVVISEKENLLSFVVTNPGSLPRNISEQVFEPGFSTKEDGHSGLGLYISKRLTNKLCGSIKQSLDPEGNIVFTVLVPQM